MSALRGRTIAVTGGAGFVGAALVRRLTPHNDVRILDMGLHGRIDVPGAGVQAVRGDVRDAAAVDAFVAGADVILHLASIAGVTSVKTNPVATVETTMLGTLNVLRAAAEHRPDRVVVFSTSEVAGRFAYNAKEDATLSGASIEELRWTYAATKLAGEFAAAAFHAEHGVPAISLRPFNIYGPGQLGFGAVREFVRASIAGRPLHVRGDGSQIRAWCFIDDVVDAVELVCLHDAAVGKVFNVGNPRSVVTVSELAKLVRRLAESDSPIEFVPTTEIDVELRIPNITRARTLLGFEPKIDLDDGLCRTIEWFRGDGAAKRSR
ncbi:MAG: NAD-dependent epimerase/dehydratase family protein [Chloroflexi bacterium]|nr:NAD-dependent epimerase/dehydratase family protein [Chloroflexota bacterium]